MAIQELTSLLDNLATSSSDIAAQENRARTDSANRLRKIAAMGLQRRKSLGDALASSGMIHSGVNYDLQSEVNTLEDEARATESQSLNDRLANLARERIQGQMGFNIGSLLPR